MAIAFDSVSSPAGIGSNPITWTHTCATNSSLFVVTNNNPSAVTYNGVAMTGLTSYTPQPVVGPPAGNNCPPIAVWFLAHPATGAHTVSVTTATPTDCASVSYTGINYVPDVELDTDTTKQQGFNSQTVNVTGSVLTVKDNDWILGFGLGGNNTPNQWVAHAGSTLRYGGIGSILADSVFIVDSNGAKSPPGVYSTGADWNAGSGFNTLIVYGVSPRVAGFSGQMIIL